MAWDDFGYDSPASDFGSFDAYSGGSYSPQDYAGFSLGGDFQQPAQQPFSMGGSGGLDTSWLGGFGGGMGQGSAAPFSPQLNSPVAPGSMQPQQGGGMGGFMGALPGLLGAAGGLAGIAGQLAGGGQGPQQQRTLNNAGQGALGSANSMNATAATGQLPLQQMQMSLLQALQSGQGLPPGYQQLIEQAFQPQMGDLYTQAAQMGQARGFHDAPAISPPGGAILGPGLANLQGQMAQAKLGLMQSLPQTFQNPINSQISAQGVASQGLQNTAAMNSGSQSNQSIAPMIGQQVGAGLQGLGQAMNMGSTARIPMAQGGIVTGPTNALIGESGPEAVIPLTGTAANPGMSQSPLAGLMALIAQLGHGQPQHAPPESQGPRAPFARPQIAPQRPFAKGGIVTKPTNALIGEAGPEAVVPLKQAPPGLMQLIMSLLQHAQATRATGGLHGRP